ncbi:MAG: FemAB family PEP-CTERM system-associated protein [Inhella sp.]|jgi:FemAB-related protein (PEP-CTERM system-associated)|uniref:FemAB family XrtA/PEP-CTERM system-associated protein n=1 Tax=Inhella sp. TaxID=1921806 RepID=UPI0022BE3A98|nr:FemAB family XrtA/PEP-CTERM system-associated protein [Inhella sp.]MCZ8234215.1 FemAB family PEP-CTERM system-associated protein [Inhella sp.]
MNAPVTVRPLPSLAGATARAWDDYVVRHPQGTFFHQAGWARAVSRVWGHRCELLAAWQGGRLVGVLPLGEIDSLLFGHAVTSLPFAVYGGVLADGDDAAHALVAAAEAWTRARGASHLELRHLHGMQRPDWAQQDLYVTFRKPLLDDDEANLLAIPRKQRAMVRKGVGHGLRADVDADAGRFFDLFADNVHRHGTPAMPQRWFQALLEEFGSQAEVLTVVAPDGTPVSSVLSFYFRDEVLPYYAGDATAARDLAANDFKYWALMQRALRRGARVFDYGRSKQGTGPYAFKKNWGFSPTPLAYEFRLYEGQALPQHNPNNPKYQRVIETWRRLPRAVVNRLGPLIVRNLG